MSTLQKHLALLMWERHGFVTSWLVPWLHSRMMNGHDFCIWPKAERTSAALAFWSCFVLGVCSLNLVGSFCFVCMPSLWEGEEEGRTKEEAGFWGKTNHLKALSSRDSPSQPFQLTVWWGSIDNGQWTPCQLLLGCTLAKWGSHSTTKTKY